MKVTIKKRNIQLLYPFKYFLGTLTVLPYAEVLLETKDGVCGQGEVACSLDVNGETNASSLHLEPYLQTILHTADVQTEQDIEAIMLECGLKIAFNTATKCGLEQALYHILAQRQKITISQLFKPKKQSVKIQCTIPFLADQDEYLQKITHILAKQPEYIKFKIGVNIELESWAIHKARIMDPMVGISVDANQAFYSVAEALRFLSGVESVNVCWAEQLINKGHFAAWAQLKKKTQTPLMADEAIQTPNDVLLYLQNDLVDVINLKLGKCGGIIEARKIIALAHKYNKPVMLGSMVHGALGLKYNLAFGLSENFITYDFFSYFSLRKKSLLPLINKKTLRTTKEVLR